MKAEIEVDSFAGGGGASLGIAWATGKGPDIAINHDDNALKMHAANHPSTLHVREDVWKADLKKLVGKRKVGLLWLSPDCFAAGTLVLTRNGLVPIEDVRIGNEVLTHKNRWRVVTALVQKDAETIKLKGHGHYGLDVTPDHQIYSQNFAWRTRREDGKSVNVRRTNGVQWIEAEKMVGKINHFWATPHSIPSTEFTPPPAAMNSDFFYFIGRWVACGSFSKEDVVVSCGFHDAEETLDRVERSSLHDREGNPFNIRSRELPDTMQIIIGSGKLREWIHENFGRLSKTKRLPVWLLGIQRNWREAFLRGYVDGDGHQLRRMSDDSIAVIETGSASKALALGIKLLATSLGYAASFHHSVQADSEIDGRRLKGGDYYRVVWRPVPEAVHFIDDGKHRFTQVKKILPGSRQRVYCIEVADDHSFVADGIVVHNCKHFSVAKGSKPVEKNIRSLAWIAVKWAEQIKPRVIILENVREFANWGPLIPIMECRECEWSGTEGQATLVRTRRKCPRCESLKLRLTEQMVPCPDRKGLTFKRFVGRLRNLGYKVEWKNLDAADYGAPTHRKRLFLIARRDGKPIEWPEPTHAAPEKLDDMPLFDRLQPYRTAAECIDWDIHCPSIFDRKKPLAEKTLKRIALGIKRFVLENPKPYIVRIGHTHGDGGYGYSADQPLTTITSKAEHLLINPVTVGVGGAEGAGRPKDLNAPSSTVMPHDRRAVVVPIVAGVGGRAGQSHATGGGDPLGTITAKNDRVIVTPVLSKYHGQKTDSDSRCSEFEQPFGTLDTQPRYAVVSPTLVECAHGDNGSRRDRSPHEPLGTVTQTGNHAVAVASLVQTGYGEREGQAPRALDPNKPLGTVVAGGAKHAAATAYIARHHGGEGSEGREVDRPAPTVVGRETTNQLCTAYIAKHFGGMVGVGAETPLPTTTMKGCQNQIVAAHLHRANFDDAGTKVDAPVSTLTTNNHAGLVYAFLTKYFGTAIGARVDVPHPTNTTKERTGLITVTVEGEPYVIVDIGMRMLTPRELARCQGFPDTYELTGTKTSQVARIGNSVCPHVAKALVEANYAAKKVAV